MSRLQLVKEMMFDLSLKPVWLIWVKGAIAFLLLVGMSLLPVLPAQAVSYNRANLVNCDFSHQDLRDAEFDHANLRGCDFSGSDLRGVRFFSANLESANFTGANLRASDFESARLTHANFTDAVLEGAFGTNTKWGEAVITGADFTDMILRPDVENYLCGLAQGKNPETGRNTRDTLFCE